ncbi:GntR family transcriptional regulator [Kribbella aluminosa]|uniref:GntR family transcriptional regulator n=1 Tax=Kribbella aluminosa TaxID=416017 RepID=A0ABS4UCC8_9ACTN|nr:GntR family transcriptional regulator [Kribbella aluminosa]MBP2349303.1 GntR family transcriptional regulator [Kribbella aluminosa]
MTVEDTRHPLAVKVTQVDRRSPMPAWAQVERDLRSVLDQGVEAGLQLPTEKDLAAMYGVSRITVRQALAALSDRGYVERRQGMGTFVADRPRLVQHDIGLMTPWRDRFRAAGEDAASVHLADAAPEEEPYDLVRELTPAERSGTRLHLKRLHLVNGRPIGITDSWLAGRAAETMQGRELVEASLSKTLQHEAIAADQVEHLLEVRSVNAAETVLLDTGIDSQVFVDWSIGRSGGELVETSRTVWLGSRVRFHYSTDLEGLHRP